mgnify:FL=1
MSYNRLKELLSKTGEFQTESALNYLIYKSLNGGLDKEDLEILNNVNSEFSKSGEEGVNFENYMLYTKLNIYNGQKEIYDALIDQIEAQLNQNLLLPEDDIFSIYKGVAILESLADKHPMALDQVNDILKMISESDVDISGILEGIAANLIDNIHLRQENLYLLDRITEMAAIIKEPHMIDKYWSNSLSKLLLRLEDKPTLNEKIVSYVEANLEKVGKSVEKLGIYYGLALHYLELNKINPNENTGKAELYQNLLAKTISSKAPVLDKLYRDVLVSRLKAKKDENVDENLRGLFLRYTNFKKQASKENVDAAVYVISTGLSKLLKDSKSDDELIRSILKVIDDASDIVKIWGLIDVYTKLSILRHKETDEIFGRIISLIESMGEEKEEILEDWLTSSLAEIYSEQPDEGVIDKLIEISQLEGSHPEEIYANFFSSLSYFAESKKFVLGFSS